MDELAGDFQGECAFILKAASIREVPFLSTLAYFHEVEHKQNYKALFQTLDVDRDVDNGKVRPRQYLVLAFDFSAVNRSPDVEAAEASLNDMLSNTIRTFYRTYTPHLGTATSDQLIEKSVSPRAIASLADCVSVPQYTLGRIDILIQVPLKKQVVLLEWKAIQIDFLDVGTSWGRKEKNDRWRSGQTIRSWITVGPIKGENSISPRQQLAEYVNSPEIALLKKVNVVTAFLAVIIGSRQVLIWEMDNGEFRKDPDLAS
ncbi:hypothetical protein BGZ79_001232 [Entomortierella chlamydospora]|nr:hypothetical protein BGZ79_001232 [Entomortierella chlamydospora]